MSTFTNEEQIIQVLKENGLSDKYTPAQVLEDFNTQPELTEYLLEAEAGDEYAVVLKHMADWMAVVGLGNNPAADPTIGQDPTQIEDDSGVARPVDTDAAFYRDEIRERSVALSRNSKLSSVEYVLIERPYPGEWMTTEALSTKKDVVEVAASLRAMRREKERVDDLLSKDKFVFIPTNKQMQELKASYLSRKTDNGKERQAPAWADFDNDTAFKNIIATLESGNGLFEPFIPPAYDETEGTDKNKAWRWKTIGFQLKVPSSESGPDKMETKVLDKKATLAWIISNTREGIDGGENGVSLALREVKESKRKKSSGTVAGPVRAALKVKGNNNKTNPARQCVFQQTDRVRNNGLVCRSKAFYYVCRTDSEGNFRVTKERISLLWVNAKEWDLKPEYDGVFDRPGSGGLSIKDKKNFESLQVAGLQDLAQSAEGADSAIILSVQNRKSQHAQQLAASMGI